MVFIVSYNFFVAEKFQKKNTRKKKKKKLREPAKYSLK